MRGMAGMREQDFRDVETYLEFMFGFRPFIRPHTWVGSPIRTLTGVTAKDRQTAELAKLCLQAAGYAFELPPPERSMRYIFRPPFPDPAELSEHERLRAIRRFRFVQENQAGPISSVRDRGTLDHPYM